MKCILFQRPRDKKPQEFVSFTKKEYSLLAAAVMAIDWTYCPKLGEKLYNYFDGQAPEWRDVFNFGFGVMRNRV